MANKQAESKQGKAVVKSAAKPAKGSAVQPAPAAAVPWAAEQLQQTYGNSAVLKYLQSGPLPGQMSFARPTIGTARYGIENDGPNMSQAGGKPLSVEQAEAFAAVARPPTPAEVLNAKREEKKADDKKAWDKIRKDKVIQAAVKEAAELTGIDAATLEKMIIMESAGNKNSHNGAYYGLMQLGEGAFQDARDKPSVKKLFNTLKVKDEGAEESRAVTWEDVKSDPRLNVLVGAIYAKYNLKQIQAHNNEVIQKRPVPVNLIESPAAEADKAAGTGTDELLLEESAQNLYFAHQQGFNGMRGIYEKPDAKIGKNQKGNMTPTDKEHYTKEGAGKQITNAEYLEAWKERMNRIDQFMTEGTKNNGQDDAAGKQK
ncbi:hypothetical protein [Paenibacillus kobensis]|uniref:hypothetical protein n=1 Tax=Paenibacillus kobensis TaxID=59841 RepID=UPI000FDB9E60|nr:hypothetical protein [Paenibacillus kobensis]